MLAAWLEVLRERDWAATVIVPTDVTYSGYLAVRLEAMGCEVHALDFPVLRRRELTPAGALRLLRRLLASWQPLRRLAQSSDVVLLSTSAVLLGVLATLGTGVKRSVHVQEYIGDGTQGKVLCSESGLFAMRSSAVPRQCVRESRVGPGRNQRSFTTASPTPHTHRTMGRGKPSTLKARRHTYC